MSNACNWWFSHRITFTTTISYRVGMLLILITGSVQEGDTSINWAVESIMEAGAKLHA